VSRTALADEETVRVHLVRHRHRLAQDPDDPHIVEVGLFRPGDLVIGQLRGGPQKEDAEEVEHIRPAGDRRRAEPNKYATQNERHEDAGEQYLLLVLTWDLKRGEDQREDEQVIDAERLLSDVAGKEFQPVLVEVARLTPGEPEEDPEDHRQANIKRRPECGFLQRRLMRRAHVGEKIENKET